MYDEKILLADQYTYHVNSLQIWMKVFCDYMAGRTSDMAKVLDWVEGQVEEIGDTSIGGGDQPMIDFSSLDPVTRQ